MSELSAQTRAEMAAGAKAIALAAAWSKVGDWELEWRKKLGAHGRYQTVVAMVWQRPEGIVVEAFVKSEGADELKFPVEPIETFPSGVLTAQIMLVAG